MANRILDQWMEGAAFFTQAVIRIALITTGDLTPRLKNDLAFQGEETETEQDKRK